MKKELGLVKNPTPKQLEEIIQNKRIKNKEKTVYFKDVIKEVTQDSDDIIDAEIIKKTVKVRVKNAEL